MGGLKLDGRKGPRLLSKLESVVTAIAQIGLIPHGFERWPFGRVVFVSNEYPADARAAPG